MFVPFEDLPEDALAFIYQSDKELSDGEAASIEEKLHTFIAGWTSHQLPVNGFGKVYHHRFIVLFGDETDDKIGGCSKDKVNQFVRMIGEQYHINLFDRLQVAYMEDGRVKTLHLSELSEAVEAGRLRPDTAVFNNLVPTKNKWEKTWKQPLYLSPFSRYIIQKAD